MEMKNLVGMVLAVTVALLVAGTVLAPTVDDMRITAGDEITITNESSRYYAVAESGDVLECVSTYDTDSSTVTNAWSFNGDAINNVSYGIGVLSDGLYCAIASASGSAGYYEGMDLSTPNRTYLTVATSSNTTVTHTFTFSDSAITVSKDGSTVAEYDYSWGYIRCPVDYADASIVALQNGVAIANSIKDIVLGGEYSSGDNDCMYYYYNGVAYVSNDSYDMTVDYTSVVHEGTTDIYDYTVSANIGDESFTPYWVLAPVEVTGHATSGAFYDILGVIVVVVILAIMMIAVGFVVRRD